MAPSTQNKRFRIIRFLVRGAALLLALAAAWPWASAPAWAAGAVPVISPYLALLSWAAGAAGLYALFSLPLLLAAVFWPRAFCRWACPAGTCQDAAARFCSHRAWTARVPRIGPWLVFIGLGAALAGYPLFGWLDPLVLFNGPFGLARQGLTARDWAAAAGLPALLLLSVAAPDLWCGKLCPLGALQDCVREPIRWLKKPSHEKGGPRAGSALPRRIFLGLGLGAGYRLALSPAQAEKQTLRPPVTGTEARFTRLCVRCGACVRACPNGILHFGGSGSGWAGVLAPEIRFGQEYCPPSCTACGQSCPVGAIPKFTAEDKLTAPIGLATVDTDACLLSAGRDCGACAAACPQEALELAWDPKEMSSRVVVRARACTGCGYCEYVCPATPTAIRVKPGGGHANSQQRRFRRKGKPDES